MTTVFEVLADPGRRRVLDLLRDDEHTVTELVDALGMSQPAVSKQLRVLRDAGLVESEKWRYWTYYRLNQGAIAALGDQLAAMAANAPAPASERRPCC